MVIWVHCKKEKGRGASHQKRYRFHIKRHYFKKIGIVFSNKKLYLGIIYGEVLISSDFINKK